MGRGVDEPPRLRRLDEIDMELVDKALEMRRINNGVIKAGAAATEFVRLLRAQGAFGSKSPEVDTSDSEGNT